MSINDGVAAELDAMAAQAGRFIAAADAVASVVQQFVTDPSVQNPGFGADASGRAGSDRLQPPLQSGVQATSDLSVTLTEIGANMARWVESIRRLDDASY